MKFTVPKGSHYVRHLSLLELAVGWPKGVFILLEFGADALEVDLRRCPYRTAYADDLDCDDFRDSLAPLLQRGCVVRSEDIHQCNSKTIRALLINELTNRRKRLHDVARSCLPPSRFAEITGPGIDESIIDVHAFQIYAELIATNLMVDRSLECDATSDAPVYHHKNYEPYATLNAWDDLYLAGFRDVDLPDSRGLTPLMVAGLSPEFAENRVIWLVGKGASLSKRIPFSNTTVAHLMTSRLFRKLFEGLQFGVKYDQGDHMSPKSINYHKHTIFLFPSIRDCCTCFCSDGGCTTLSVALRECSASYLHQWTPSTTPSKSSYIFGLQSLIDLREETQERDHTIIRFLTFEALGLRHTCCREIMNIGYFENYARDIMDENEVRNIQEEDQHRYQQLDELVEDLKTRFDDLRLPIIDFLDGPWYARMAQVLSARDPYDEEHILQNRNNGIFLEPVESHDIPPFFSIFSSQIQDWKQKYPLPAMAIAEAKTRGVINRGIAHFTLEHSNLSYCKP
ncbi:hypothetical protein N7456_011240 [Penicillium angulare]|uniref:Uncharacterized protein n=1 Tax=Penicillium angulare TaxID=116970 RepID=A0A9W9ETI5_9EURO|nr:hypothetical protein N7456_011240 [Penicillium angulare]